jgi:glycosyltransferase involved in cell wall biosynthesis
MKRLILTQIVRDESKIIQRCFESVSRIIDAWVVCDTGSIDDTPNIIQTLIQENLNGVGAIHHDPWKNFGHNRTNSLIKTTEFCQNQGWPLDETYALLLDADMLLVIDENFKKEDLIDFAYRFIQKNQTISYANTRLIRLDSGFTCVGVTHEYWSAPKSMHVTTFEKLYINDIGDGGAKADKFNRDIRLLQEGLMYEPKNSRYFFYLAQSYRDLKQYDQAYYWYQKRVDSGGWPEEKWYALVEAAKCQWNLGNQLESIDLFLKAFDMRPTRAESLYHLAFRLRHARREATAFLLIMQAKRIPYPTSDLLFVEHRVYTYLLDFEASVTAFYAKEMEVGRQCCQKLLQSSEVPDHIKELTRRNEQFYL